MPEDNNIEKTFTEEIQGLRHLPHNDIVKAFDSKEFPLGGNPIFSHRTGEMAAEEYKRCLELFERRSPNEFSLDTMRAVVMSQMRLQPIINSISLKEMNHREALENIAEETIREMFDVPEHVELLPKLTTMDDIDMDTEQDDSSEPLLSLTEEEQKEMKNEIQKRIILNSLVHGCSIHIWKSAHYIIREQINQLDDMLMMLYDEYTSAISWLLWEMPPSLTGPSATVQGFNELNFNEEGCKIEATAMNFPVLLHEVAKGAMDYLTSHAIPQEYTEEQLTYYYAAADNYDDEIWHYLLGPTFWNKLIQAADVETQSLPKVIAGLAKMDYQELIDVMKACMDSAEEGNVKLKNLKLV